ncbi:MAG: alpha/beta fold hydrolase [Verrucomicrobia bacterium]|nr:alpha/beta fold hydrolase [Verrucomicrobiota bacterium]
MRLSHLVLTLLGAASAALAAQAATPAPAVAMTLLRLPNGERIGLIGEHPGQPAPTLFVLQGTLDVARAEPIYTEIARLLAKHGYMSVLLDAPGHGEDHRPNEPTELNSWRERLDHGEDFVASFTARARAVLDYLVKERYADPSRVAACGTSRGGFLAFQLAAAEPRIRCIGGISPVTDLRALREFDHAQRPAAADALALIRVVPQLAGRPAWISIGNNDHRVSTEAAIAFSRALVHAGATKVKDGDPVPVELIVNTSPGHRSSFHDHELLAEWMLEHMK